MLCFFVSDLHGHPHRYLTLFDRIEDERPDAVFLGGDVLPGTLSVWKRHDPSIIDFTADVLTGALSRLRKTLGSRYPRVFLIPGNDDRRSEIEEGIAGARHGLWEYLHARRTTLNEFEIYGYGCVPPTPFRLKDWERYDVSRYVDPGCVPPDEGIHTCEQSLEEIRRATIQEDLELLASDHPLDRAIMLFHSPPYHSGLDRAGLDGKFIDHVPLDVHVGSIAIQRFLERRQPMISLHGHVHESARLTGRWQETLGRTHMYSAAHDGRELALVRFDPAIPHAATRDLL